MTDQVLTPELQAFMKAHQLPKEYIKTIETWFTPLIDHLVASVKKWRQANSSPYLLGINGSQGSGKSTLAALLSIVLKANKGIHALELSIDDFYLSKAERKHLACDIHPLLATRGVPGTHDTHLLIELIETLSSQQFPITIPRFDKSVDDRKPNNEWDIVNEPVDLIILEGWCVGSMAEPTGNLTSPINRLEETEDKDGTWRRYVNDQLKTQYAPLFHKIHYWVMLQAPSFDCVFNWRLQQEEKLKAKSTTTNATGIMSPEKIARFIQHYQRITEHTLKTLPPTVDCLFVLDKNRQIMRSTLDKSRQFDG